MRWDSTLGIHENKGAGPPYRKILDTLATAALYDPLGYGQEVAHFCTDHYPALQIDGSAAAQYSALP
jgi:hypothetical protein